MRLIGLDLGTRTLGIAISDKLNVISSPLKTIRFKEGDYNSILNELEDILNKYKITDIVLGLPKNMDNSCGFAAKRSLDFKELLESNFSLPIHLVDERLSSVEAENILLSTDMKRMKRKKVIDNVAAAIILDTFLKERRNNNERKSEK